jgi:hypothetical protein
MATLALTTIGNALGGPIGGAIGGLIGNGIDRSLFGPGPRQGPRLNDLSVQTSSYGTQIPRVYGTMRVAGTVVWATELKESNEPQSGAKGQPDVIVYSYSASFAVALSSRRATRIGRIWADGKLLRGVAGDFKVKTGFRFYPGDEDQPIDPLIASVEGIGSTTAYRGLALAVFEDLQLAEYGNRIPFLTFELIAGEQEPTVGEIVNDAGGGSIECSAAESVVGYAAYGGSRAASVQPLVEQFAVSLFDDGDRLRTPETVAFAADNDELCAPKSERDQAPARALPCALELTYYDPARDFQTGQMRASAASSDGTDVAAELPAALSADRAKALAETSLARRWAQRDRLTLRLPPDRLDVVPGSIVIAEGSAWRVDEAVVEELVVRLSLSRVWDSVVSAPADSGTHLPAPDQVAAPTTLIVLDLPDLGMGRHDVPTLQIAACQTAAGWQQVAIEVTSGGEVWTIASAPIEAVIGTALSTLGESDSLDVELADPEHWLESRDQSALTNGANLAAVGSELIQFASAVPIGPKRFRLSGLVRGCRGTEWAMGSHSPGEVFVLTVAGALQEVVLPPLALGTSVSIKPRGLADDDAQPVERIVTGEAMRPPSPIDVLAEITSDGGLSVSWTGRSRLGWMWPEGSDVPLGESAEKYRVTVEGSAITAAFEAFEPRMIIPADALAGMAGALTICVVQIGDYAESRPAAISLTLG